jgi:hypothetical protein
MISRAVMRISRPPQRKVHAGPGARHQGVIAMHALHRQLAAIALLTLAATGRAAGPGLAMDAPEASWPRWGARLQVSTDPLTQGDLPAATALSRAHAVQLLGDFYIARPRLGEAGGLRLTSGLWMSARRDSLAVGLPWASATLESWPYLGIGYSASSPRGGWGLHADLGLAMRNPGGLKLDRLVSGGQTLDDAMRELRLRPVVQIGASYSF